MPGRRPVQKGSFGGHFDELVKHFPHDEPETRKDEHRKKRDSRDANVHDRLFESAWRDHKRAH
jgi:hypothetical protein